MKRECVDCEWCKSLDDSEGNAIYFAWIQMVVII